MGMTGFGSLRAALEAARDQIAERLAALDHAEAAMVALATAFGIDPARKKPRQTTSASCPTS
jgi:hypothetical protein